MTTFQVLYNASTHWPIPSYNPFCQIQYVSPYFNADIDGAHNFPVEQGHNVLPIGEPFYKGFSQQFEHNFFWQIYWGGCSTWRIKDQIVPRIGEFHKCIFQ